MIEHSHECDCPQCEYDGDRFIFAALVVLATVIGGGLIIILLLWGFGVLPGGA